VLDGYVLRRCARVIAVSGAVERDLLELALRQERIVRIPSGITFDRVDGVPRRGSGGLRRELGLSVETPLVGMVATLEPKKAQDVLLRAAPAVLDRCPATHFVLIGGDHAPYQSAVGSYGAELRRLAESLQVSHRVHVLGFRPDARALLEDLDVSVLCSRKEGLGLTAIESLAAGVPLVATAVEGLREVVDHGETGLLVPPDAPAALASAIGALLADRALTARLGAAGQRAARERFDASRLARRNLDVYESLLGVRGRERQSPRQSRCEAA
jgi:glycosyltransferase involved in cell wall biosynthesis